MNKEYLPYFEEDFKFAQVKYHNIRNTYLITISSNIEFWEIIDSGLYSKALYTKINGINIINVHLPLDVKQKGERTDALTAYCSGTDGKKLIMGDFNPINMVDQMDKIYDDYDLTDVELKFDNDEYVVSTFYGRDFERPEFQGFNAPLIFDKCITSLF